MESGQTLENRISRFQLFDGRDDRSSRPFAAARGAHQQRLTTLILTITKNAYILTDRFWSEGTNVVARRSPLIRHGL